MSGCSDWLVMALMFQLLLWTFPSSSCHCVNSNPLSHKTPTLFCWWNHDNYWDKNKISKMESRMSSLIWLDLKGIRDPVFCSQWDHGHPWHTVAKWIFKFSCVVTWGDAPIESRARSYQVLAALECFHRNKENNDCEADSLLLNRRENFKKLNNKTGVL